jgi:fido (protein-threonine AMPylation protein)
MAFFLAMFYCCKCDMEMFLAKEISLKKNWKRKLDEIDMFSQSSKIGNGEEFIAWKLKDKIISFSFKCKYAVLMELHKCFFNKIWNWPKNGSLINKNVLRCF